MQPLIRMQCLVYCVADLLPSASSLVHCLRAFVKYRILLGMTTLTESRKAVLREVIADYDKACTVSEYLFREICCFTEYVAGV